MTSGGSSDDGRYSEESSPLSSASSNGSEIFERTIALFRKATVAAYVKRTVALFAMIGVGIGFAGYLTISLLLSGGGILDVTLGFVLAVGFAFRDSGEMDFTNRGRVDRVSHS